MSETRFPTSPLDIDTTKALLREKIEAGEITQQDIDILKRGYRWMTTSSIVGGLVAVPVYIAIGRRQPPIPVWKKLAFSMFASSSGSFLGFTLGGAAAALEVSKEMVDSERKMRVFQKVMWESRKLADEKVRSGSNPSRLPPSPSSIPSPSSAATDENGDSVWDPEKLQNTAERERELGLSNSSSSSPASSPSAITPATTSTWDRLRRQAPPDLAFRGAAPVGRSGGPGEPMTDKEKEQAERAKEQAAFDQLLEKERNLGEAGGFGEKEWK